MPSKPNRRTREAFAVVSYSNMLMLNALAQLLTEKGILTKEEVLRRIEILRKKMPRHGAPLVCAETASATGGLRENGRQAFLRLPATPVHGICCGREEDKGEAGWFDVGGEEVKRSVLHGLHIQSCAPDSRNHQDVDELFRFGRQLKNVLKGTIRKPGIGENQ